MGKKAFEPEKTRNFALVGHRSSGKTSLAEMLLTQAQVTRTVGRVDDGTSLLDFTDLERRRGMTLDSSFAWIPWRDHLLMLTDTPGGEGLSHRRRLALSAADAAVVVVSATDGVEFGTERSLAEAEALGIPALLVLNRIDRVNEGDAPEHRALMQALSKATTGKALPLQLPFYDDQGQFAGLIELLDPEGPRAYRYDPYGSGRYSAEPVPERYRGQVLDALDRLTEQVAMGDDQLLEEYLEFLELPLHKVRDGMARLVARRDLVPLLYTSSQLLAGSESLLDALCDLLPAPGGVDLLDESGATVHQAVDGPFTAQLIASQDDGEGKVRHVVRVWSGSAPRSGAWVNARTGEKVRVNKLYNLRGPRRTVAATVTAGSVLATWEPLPGRPGDTFTLGPRLRRPAPDPEPSMLTLLITPRTARDERALPTALQHLCALDPSLSLSEAPAYGGFFLEGQGRVHLDATLDHLRDTLGVQVRASLPPIPYVETPMATARNAHGLHRKVDSQLVSEMGECWLDVVPAAPDEGLRFEAVAPRDRLPEKFVLPLENGVREAALHGPAAGYPVVGLDVRIVDGEYDVLCSEDAHFERAGATALRAALRETGTELLEPWSLIHVTASAEDLGSVISDLQTRRGRILDLQVGADTARVQAHLPFRETRELAPKLQSLTGGRGRFTAQPSHYERLPKELVREALDASPWRHLAQPIRLEDTGARPMPR